MKKLALLIFVLVVLSGCAASSAVKPYGKDSYMISVDDIMGGDSPGKLQVKAEQKAKAYCAKQGKVMHVSKEIGHGVKDWTSTSANLIFSCIDENDPENTRPDPRKEADTVIEDSR